MFLTTDKAYKTPMITLIERPHRVRLAGPEDEDAIFALLLDLNADNGFGYPVSEEKVRGAIRLGTERKGAFVAVIDGKDELAASIALLVNQFWYSEQPFLGEGWVFVREDYRHNGFENDLFQFAKWTRQELSRSLGQEVPLVLQMWGATRLPAKMRLWSRHGEQVGGIFLIRE